ncbi:FAD/NAD-P-binding domain-containing protein [Trametes maxima]|nr:FAD/NAD-P-binding domain-containing protein [Trametes maxima]
MTEKAVKNVVIVGAGWAGVCIARELSSKLNAAKYTITLVNERPYLIHLIAGARLVVAEEDHLEDKALIPYDRLFRGGNGTVKIGKVVSVHETAPGKGGEVRLENGETLPYDALVFSTGSTWTGPLEFPQSEADVRAYINVWRGKCDKAKHVIVVGGGPLGLEFAAEIKEVWPNKKVTVIHGQNLPINNTYPDKFRKDIETRSRQRGIEFIYNDRVDTPPEGTVGVTTRGGKHIPDADLVLPAYGSRPNTSVVSTLADDVLTKDGFVRITEHLEIPGHPGVFAAGDIIDFKERKQAAKAGRHARVVIPNIISFLEGKPLKSSYNGVPEMIVIPLGKTGGSGYFDFLWGIIVGDWVSKTLLGKDLMVKRARAYMGY